MLESNFPNPFNPATNIRYRLPRSSWVEFSVYNIEGECVQILVDAYQSGCTYLVQLNGWIRSGILGSGAYFAKFHIVVWGEEIRTLNMILLK